MTDLYSITIGTSDFPRLVLCPGALHAAAKSEKREPEAHTTRGTRIHEAHEHQTDEGLDAWDEVDVFARNTDIENRIIAAVLPGCQIIREQPLALEGTRLRTRGLDFLGISGDAGLIIDYKTGRKAVDHAAHNHQLMAEMLLAAFNHGLSEVTVAIVQPTANREGYTIARYDLKGIVDGHAFYLKVEAAALDPNAPRRPSVAACQYCPAMGTGNCHESLAIGLLVSRTLNNPEFTRSYNLLSPADRGAVSAVINGTDVLRKRHREYMKAVLEADPTFIAGFAIGKGSSSAVVEDTGTAHLMIKDAGLLDSQRLWACTKVSVPDLVKALRDRVAEGGGEMSDNEAKQKVYLALGQLIQWKQGEPTLKAKKEKA